MIYDAHMGLIFVKTLKVSGSSFEAAIIPLLSRNAIATINESWTSGGRKVDAISHRRTTWLPLRRLIPQILRHRNEARHIPMDLLRRRGPRHEAFSVEKDHMSADDIRAMIGQKEWDRCTKIEIARNPYERLVSYYFMKKKQSHNPDRFPTFKDWLVMNPELILKNERLVSVTDDDGVSRPDVDLVLYYEDMDASLAELAERFGLDAQVLIERYHATRIHDEYRPRDASGSVAQVVDPESKQLIDIVKSMRFDRLGYSRTTDKVVPIRRSSPQKAGPTPSRAVS
ncbi:MAG: hypothetical protein EBY89_02755 [Actinobacteria bacterium]|nr:hypothetical protein [Actinomycetota bacterium]